MNLCINCEYYKIGEILTTSEYARCTHPATIAKKEINPVDGKEIIYYQTDNNCFDPQTFHVFCQFVRLEGRYCGPEGKLYKEAVRV